MKVASKGSSVEDVWNWHQADHFRPAAFLQLSMDLLTPSDIAANSPTSVVVVEENRNVLTRSAAVPS